MQVSGNKGATLVDLTRGEEAVITGFELPEDVSRRLMELGFLPGHRVKAGSAAPGGDPRVFEVDGSQVAVRRETARHIQVERA
jgi:ferrous iron transport protein A